MSNNVENAKQYAADVYAGVIPACKWVVSVCRQFLDELEIQERDDFSFYFDERAAEKAARFMQLFPHTKGRWARNGDPLRFEPWQCFFVCQIFGWKVKSTGFRRYTRAVLIVPRKNGKSDLAARIGLYMLAGDNEFAAEVYSGATTQKQAWEVFKPARLMALKEPDFLENYGVSVNASNISILETGAKFEPIIGNPGDGSSPSCAIIDEYHEHVDDRMLETMETGMGAREQPIALIITTAGDNLAGSCYQLMLECQQNIDGALSMPDTFALIYTVDQGDDWTSADALKKANPNFGVSVAEEFLIRKLAEAKNNARKQAAFKTKHLNIWVGARDAYFNVEKWNSLGNPDLKLSDFEGRECFMGLDLASKIDIAALELLFPMPGGGFVRFGRYYLPETQVENGTNQHYIGWQTEGFLTITDGEIIDYDYIMEDILHFSTLFQVREVAYDPHQATMLVTELTKKGVPVVEIRPTVLNFSEPMKFLESLIRAGKITHDGDPVMSWQISNVTAKEDKKENVYPTKSRRENKIDSVVALLMAFARAMTNNEPAQDISAAIYEPISG